MVSARNGSGDPESERRVGERYVFGMIGRLYPDKGHRFFLELCQIGKGFPFVTAEDRGRWTGKNEISHLADTLG